MQQLRTIVQSVINGRNLQGIFQEETTSAVLYYNM
jgi:hypothetical protein